MYHCNLSGTPHTHLNEAAINDCWRLHYGWEFDQEIWVTPNRQDAATYVKPSLKPAPLPPGAIAARFESQCPCCLRRIGVGDPIVRHDGSRWRCAPACPTSPATLPPGSTSRSAAPVSATSEPAPIPHRRTARKSMFEGPFIDLLEKVPDGYFAVRDEEGAPITFLRVNRPQSSTKRLKVQTQHAERLEERWVRWQDGQISIYSNTIEEVMLVLITSYKEAARLYGKELGKCARCNTELTDDRSRWLSIGPECEKYWPWFVDERMAEAVEAGETVPDFV